MTSSSSPIQNSDGSSRCLTIIFRRQSPFNHESSVVRARSAPKDWKMIRSTLTQLGVLTAHPAAFVIVGVYVAAWLLFSPETFEWHAAATIATWLMTLFIQRAEHRDTQAIHAKLDELLRAEGLARNELTGLDDEEPETIEEHRAQERNPTG